MNLKFFRLSIALLAGALAASAEPVEERPPMTPIQKDRSELIARIMQKVRDQRSGADDLAPEFAELEVLAARYQGDPEAAASIAMIRARLSLDVLQDEAAGKAQLEALQKNFPGTPTAGLAGRMLALRTPEAKAARAAQLAAEKAKQDELLGAMAPEIEFAWSSRTGLKTLADLRGQVVVLDFWATWCGPCILSFPAVREEVVRFRNSPVVILGVTSLQGKVHGLEPKLIDVQGDPAREYALTAEFAQKHEMTWPIAFSTQKVFNPDYLVAGIPNVVILDPSGKVRHLGLNPHAPDADLAGKITALLKEFNLPLPH